MRSRRPPLSFGPAPALPPETFAQRRERLLERIGEGVVVVPAARELLKSRDTDIPFRQSSDLYYLTGFPEPQSVAVITPHDPAHRLTLFVREKDLEREAWSGARIGVDAAAERFGADAVYPIAELPRRLPGLLRPADLVHCPLNVESFAERSILDGFHGARQGSQRTGRGPRGIVDLEVSTGELRLVKDDAELERMKVAAEVTAAGHIAAMEHTRPGLGEWEIQAELERAFRSAGAAPAAFPSIVGAGANATTLHYVTNDGRAAEGDLVLVDAGAEWGMYCADITRTFPVSGRFEPLQREVYAIVLAAEEAAIAAVRPGAPVTDLHEAALRILVQGMIDLGLLKDTGLADAIETGAYKRFYLHNTSHWLGLDVHDVGPYNRNGKPIPFEPGMVLTVEPGLYIPADADVPDGLRGMGVRIEDNLVVTATGAEILTRGVPVEPAEIEAVMSGD